MTTALEFAVHPEPNLPRIICASQGEAEERVRTCHGPRPWQTQHEGLSGCKSAVMAYLEIDRTEQHQKGLGRPGVRFKRWPHMPMVVLALSSRIGVSMNKWGMTGTTSARRHGGCIDDDVDDVRSVVLS